MPASTATGTIEKIAKAQTPEEVAALVAHAVGRKKVRPQVLTRINRAAVKRNDELSRP